LLYSFIIKKMNMHTVNISIKKTVLALMVLMAIGNGAIAQDSSKTARNFVGLYGGLDLTQTSRFMGISYEYLAYVGKRKEIGFKANYTFAYRGGNLIWYSEDADQPSVSSIGLALTGYLYTNPQKGNTGFFISGEAGLSGTGWQFLSGLNQLVRPTVGLGFGWKRVRGKGQTIRWSNGLTYAGPNLFTDAGLTATTTLSFGF
jgi:hypothetical protein